MATIPEKEKLVVQLYRENRSYREIARIARISVRDIKPIPQKYGADSVSGYAASDYRVDDDIPISSKAYKLFSDGKSPLQVSIALNLRAPDSLSRVLGAPPSSTISPTLLPLSL